MLKYFQTLCLLYLYLIQFYKFNFLAAVIYIYNAWYTGHIILV